MAYSSQDGTLEKGTALTFGSWTYIADGSGGFISHLDDRQAEESDSINRHLSNNSAAPAATVENPPEDTQEGENSDLIPMCRSLPTITIQIQPQMGGQLSDRIAKCVNLAQETLEHSGTPYIMAPDEYHQPEHLTGYLDRVKHSFLHCISIAQSTLGKDCALSTAKPRITRLHYPSPNDLLGQVDRVDKTLLECINLAESTRTPGNKTPLRPNSIKNLMNL